MPAAERQDSAELIAAIGASITASEEALGLLVARFGTLQQAAEETVTELDALIEKEAIAAEERMAPAASRQAGGDDGES